MKAKRKIRVGLILVGVVLVIVAALVLRLVIARIERERYSGHGFDYMHGYSSTDFTGYHVYDGEKLVTLDHEPSFTIEDPEKMPILDGAEACYPVYTAVAKALYKDIDKIEEEAHKKEGKINLTGEEEMWTRFNGRIVTFSNTVQGYDRLIYGAVDLMFGARPSGDQKAQATYFHEEIISTTIGKEAFVFFVEEDNPVDNLTSDQIRAIYHGDITNWKEVGGKNQKIVAFQRPESSGSQVAMVYFMGDVSLKEPDTTERIDAMGGVISEVKEYNNEKGAMGYTFQYFLTGLQQETGVKILSVDGVYPSVENIKNGSYPILVNLVCAHLASNDKPEVKQVLDFLLSEDGQKIIEETGYGPLGDVESKDIVENEIEEGNLFTLNSEDHTGTLRLMWEDTDVFELEYDGLKYKGYFYSEVDDKESSIADGEYLAVILTDWWIGSGSNIIRFTIKGDEITITEVGIDDEMAKIISPVYDLTLPEVGDRFIIE